MNARPPEEDNTQMSIRHDSPAHPLLTGIGLLTPLLALYFWLDLRAWPWGRWSGGTLPELALGASLLAPLPWILRWQIGWRQARAAGQPGSTAQLVLSVVLLGYLMIVSMSSIYSGFAVLALGFGSSQPWVLVVPAALALFTFAVLLLRFTLSPYRQYFRTMAGLLSIKPRTPSEPKPPR